MAAAPPTTLLMVAVAGPIACLAPAGHGHV